MSVQSTTTDLFLSVFDRVTLVSEAKKMPARTYGRLQYLVFDNLLPFLYHVLRVHKLYLRYVLDTLVTQVLVALKQLYMKLLTSRGYPLDVFTLSNFVYLCNHNVQK